MALKALKEKRVGLTFPAALVIVTALTYGIPVLLGWFGFYGDDWIYVYNNRLAGPGSFADFVRWDRPYSAWIYSLTGAVFGDAVLPYHLLILLHASSPRFSSIGRFESYSRPPFARFRAPR